MSKLVFDYVSAADRTLKAPVPKSVRRSKNWAMPHGNIKKQRKLRAMGTYVPNARPGVVSL